MKKFVAKLILVISLILMLGALSACKDNKTPDNNGGSNGGTSENGGSNGGTSGNGGSSQEGGGVTLPPVDLGEMFQ